MAQSKDEWPCGFKFNLQSCLLRSQCVGKGSDGVTTSPCSNIPYSQSAEFSSELATSRCCNKNVYSLTDEMTLNGQQFQFAMHELESR